MAGKWFFPFSGSWSSSTWCYQGICYGWDGLSRFDRKGAFYRYSVRRNDLGWYFGVIWFGENYQTLIFFCLLQYGNGWVQEQKSRKNNYKQEIKTTLFQERFISNSDYWQKQAIWSVSSWKCKWSPHSDNTTDKSATYFQNVNLLLHHHLLLQKGLHLLLLHNICIKTIQYQKNGKLSC